MSNEENVPRHEDEKGYDPVLKAAQGALPDYEAEERDEIDELVEDVPEEDLAHTTAEDDAKETP